MRICLSPCHCIFTSYLNFYLNYFLHLGYYNTYILLMCRHVVTVIAANLLSLNRPALQSPLGCGRTLRHTVHVRISVRSSQQQKQQQQQRHNLPLGSR